MTRDWAKTAAAILGGLALAFSGLSADAAPPSVTPPSVTPVAGTPSLGLGLYDLKALGYVVEEYFVSGTASAYALVGEPTTDGRWQVTPAASAPYVTRIVVVRPVDPKKFNGTVAVEWLNVSAGVDSPPDWSFTHRELLRGGYAYVGVSAQRVGIEGGPSMQTGMPPLKKSNPARYGTLSHPGDAFAFDIFSQAGEVVKQGKVLGPLAPKRVLALGESQSAIFLTTYVNAIDPVAKVYDGFLVHSRFGSAPLPQAGSMMDRATPRAPNGIRLRPDLRVPVITLISETDLIGGNLGGFYGARQPDNAKLRIWEMPGTAHADSYVFTVSAGDNGAQSIQTLAAGWRPISNLLGMKLAKPINAAPQHHYIAMSALAHLDAWVRTGQAPPRAGRMTALPPAGPGQPPTLAYDDNGITRGGIRTPWVDVPVAKTSGFGNSGGAFGGLVGSTEAFDAATLARLYPGGKAEYLRRFDAALARSIKAGFILPADQVEIRALAEASYPAG
ncbi:alpha/beta hydrolase domain-containing protein [Phenylobacterium sp.]|uniref:alpha/beta hydrolase domain-containing protein n=1 Tax=Phenylobacterium sp. TaxID=1871053 RepID=UPI0025CC8A79|nr:alpha/beta hydrolase domain-containing protein [Phenylobacterium sp.]